MHFSILLKINLESYSRHGTDFKAILDCGRNPKLLNLVKSMTLVIGLAD